MSDHVQGYCPMGCGRTLILGSGGYVTCSWSKCPNPSAVSDLLGQNEPDHIVVIEADTFSIQHPMRERLNGEMFDCGLHRWLASRGGPPAKPGRYVVSDFGDEDPARWSWEKRRP